MKNVIILCSGGLDSVVTAHYVKKKLKYRKIIILFFDYGQRNLLSEKKCARKCARDLGGKFEEIKVTIKLGGKLVDKDRAEKGYRKDLKNTKKEASKWYVPQRNLIFLSYALSLAEANWLKDKKVYNLFVGFKNEGKEHYPDTTPEFVEKMNLLCKKGVEIVAPLIKKDKEDIVLLGKKLGVNFRNTFSCYIGGEKHCGVCLACKLRKAGFYWADIHDPTSYNS